MRSDRSNVQDESPPRGHPSLDQGIPREALGRKHRGGPGPEDDDRPIPDREPLANRAGGGEGRGGDEGGLAAGEPGLGIPPEPHGARPEPLLGNRLGDRVMDDEADPDPRRHGHERVVGREDDRVEPGERAPHPHHLAVRPPLFRRSDLVPPVSRGHNRQGHVGKIVAPGGGGMEDQPQLVRRAHARQRMGQLPRVAPEPSRVRPRAAFDPDPQAGLAARRTPSLELGLQWPW